MPKRAKKLPGRRWMRLNICGQAWEVRVAPEVEFREKPDEPLDGLTDSDISVIWLDEKFSPASRNRIFRHELVHAVIAAANLHDNMVVHVDGKSPTWFDLEEILCDVLSAPLFDTLERNGMLRPPRSKR